MKVINIKFILSLIILVFVIFLFNNLTGQAVDLLAVLNSDSGQVEEIYPLELNDVVINFLKGNNYEIVGFTNLVSKAKDSIYYVQPGDSLYKIALQYNITVAVLKEANNLDSNMILIGQQLIIPGKEPTTPDIPDYPENGVYIVQSGDSLYKIAIRFNVTVEGLKEANNLLSDMILIGQKLIIPGAEEKPDIPENPEQPGEPKDNPDNPEKSDDNSDTPGQPEEPGNPDSPDQSEMEIYIVQPGDSLYEIARAYSTTVQEIMNVNNLVSEMIIVGQELNIPGTVAGDSDDPVFEDIKPDLVLNYLVEDGDNILSIASQFDVNAGVIKSYNKLESVLLTTGQELLIPITVSEGTIGDKHYYTQEELELMARAVHSEARGEPFAGQVAVAAVILNRVKHPLFPNDIEGVIFQPYQFSAIDDGQFWLEPNQISFVAARAALAGWDPTEGAIFYYNPETATSDWVFYRNVLIKIGNHYFAV